MHSRPRDERLVVFDNLSCLRLTSADTPEYSVESWHPIAAFIRRLNGLGLAGLGLSRRRKAN